MLVFKGTNILVQIECLCHVCPVNSRAGRSALIQARRISLYMSVDPYSLKEVEMNRVIIVLSVAFSALFTLPVWASPEQAGFAWADVVEAEPVRQVVRIPVREEVCWDEQVYHEGQARRSATPAIFGAILGGLL